jgi:Uma2 family endonuclease
MNLIARTRPVLYSFDDFCALVKEKEKADLIDGVIYMASPDNTDANRLFCWLLTLLTIFLHLKKLGEVFGSRVAFRLNGTNGPEPDIGFVKKARLHLVKRGYVAGRPDAAMEIVSPESVDRDYYKKRQQFERARVPEYWIIDEIEKKVTLLRLRKDGKYQEVLPRKGVFRSKIIKGFWLQETWLWRKSLPDPLKTLKAILKSGKSR